MKDVKIGVAIMAHNMEGLLPACINSVNWTDAIYLFDDHSADRSIAVSKKFCQTKFFLEKSPFHKIAFKQGECEVRNFIIKNAFKKTGVDVLILLDADEMMADILKPAIVSAFSGGNFDSIAINIWHLFDKKNYIDIWETKMNGIAMIDPHVRVIQKGKYFQDRFFNGSHPFIKVTGKTLCLNGAYHYHLKYFHALKLPNYSLYFLPEYPKKADVLPYLKPLSFTLPKDINKSIDFAERSGGRNTIAHYKSERVIFSSPKDAMIHPRDKNNAK